MATDEENGEEDIHVTFLNSSAKHNFTYYLKGGCSQGLNQDLSCLSFGLAVS